MYLLRIDANLLHASDKRGFNALHAATQKRYANVCEYLLSTGECVNNADMYGNTSLHIAAKNNHIHVIDVLL